MVVVNGSKRRARFMGIWKHELALGSTSLQKNSQPQAQVGEGMPTHRALEAPIRYFESDISFGSVARWSIWSIIHAARSRVLRADFYRNMSSRSNGEARRAFLGGMQSLSFFPARRDECSLSARILNRSARTSLREDFDAVSLDLLNAVRREAIARDLSTSRLKEVTPLDQVSRDRPWVSLRQVGWLRDDH